MAEIDFALLRAPFPASDIEWRVQQAGMKGDKPWAKVLPYVTNRAIQARLDEVVGPDRWRNEYAPAPDGGILCGISIKVEAEWITKWDGAENTAIEAVKGGLSNAMKRAAVQWGIGRYLYELETTFVQVSDRGDHYIAIKGKDGKTACTGYWSDPTLPSWALPEGTTTKPAAKTTSAVGKVFPGAETVDEPMTDAQRVQIKAFLLALGVKETAAQKRYLYDNFGVTPDQITKTKAKQILEALK